MGAEVMGLPVRQFVPKAVPLVGEQGYPKQLRPPLLRLTTGPHSPALE